MSTRTWAYLSCSSRCGRIAIGLVLGLLGCANTSSSARTDTAPPDAEKPFLLQPSGLGELAAAQLPADAAVDVEVCLVASSSPASELPVFRNKYRMAAEVTPRSPTAPSTLVDVLRAFYWTIDSPGSIAGQRFCYDLRLRRDEADKVKIGLLAHAPTRFLLGPRQTSPPPKVEILGEAQALPKQDEGAVIVSELALPVGRALLAAPLIVAVEPGAAILRPAFVMKGEKLAGETPRLPPAVRDSHRNQTLQGVYKFCMGKDGNVYQVTPVNSIPDADEAIAAALRTWRFKPQVVSTCVIWVMQFIVS